MRTKQLHIRTTEHIAALLEQIQEATGESKTNVLDRLIIEEAQRVSRKAKDEQWNTK